MFTCAKITLFYKRKIITLEQHDWIIFVKNELEKNIPNLRAPQFFKNDGGAFRLQWYFFRFTRKK